VKNAIPLHQFFPSYDDALKASVEGSDPKLSSVSGGASFTKTASFNEAIEVARHGDVALTAEVAKITEAIRSAVAIAVPVPQWSGRDVVGDILDIPHHLSGQPDAWLVPEDSDQSRKGWNVRTLALLAPTTYHSDITTETVRVYGAAIAALVETLRAQNHIVTLDAYVSVNNGVHLDVVRLQDAGTYVEPARLAFTLAHPSWLRRVWFGLAEGRNENDRKQIGVYSGYGRPFHIGADDPISSKIVLQQAQKLADVEKYDIVFPGLTSNLSAEVLITNVFRFAVNEGLIEADKLSELVGAAIEAIKNIQKGGAN
jgi:hypothetical protein